ncbi:MAG TPA: hypothetical protein VEU62_20830, partial [Bryobacterales bacterium]|nr:hypothetical protein [Bryobacterales bacterium]
IYTYTWDLNDEGLDLALDRIANLAGCREVMLAVSYHLATYFLPHNPRRPIYYGGDGAVYFTPDLRRYRKTRIRPRVSPVVTGPDFLHRIVEAVHKHGLQFGAWIVYLFNHHLPATYPEFAKHDAFGNPYPGQLSPAPPDVQEYVVSMTQDIVENYRPAAVHVESLSRLHYSYGFQNPKVLSRIPPRAEFLLGLCFNPASLAQARAAGMDAEKFRQEVAAWLRPRLEKLPRRADLEPPTDAWIAEAFDGRLRQYLDAGSVHATALWQRVAEVIHRGGAKLQTILATPQDTVRSDLAVSVNPHIDRLTIDPVDGGDASRQHVRDQRRQIAPGGAVMVSLQPGQFTEPGPVEQQVHAAVAAGAGGATFYNYGLLREEQLGFIGQALRTL